MAEIIQKVRNFSKSKRSLRWECFLSRIFNTGKAGFYSKCSEYYKISKYNLPGRSAVAQSAKEILSTKS